MFHICFAANEPYIKYNAVLITSIIKSTDTSKNFKDFFESNKREREREQRNLKISLNSANAKNLGDLAQDSSDSNATDSSDSALDSSDSKIDSSDSTPQTSLQNYKKLDYESLSDDEKSEGYVFHILSDFVSNDSRQKLDNLAKELSKIYPCRIEIHICDDSVFEGMPKFRGNNLAFYRVLIPNFMPKNLNLCLYLDIDMLVHSDLRELFSLDLENKYAGVVEHCLGFHILGLYAKNPQDKDYYFMDFYFNSGFLLFNLNAWQKYNLKHKVLDFATRYNIICPDQDALNGIINKENALVLPYEYNMLIPYYYPCGILWNREGYITRFPHTKEQMDFAHSNPIIWHYLAESKPYKGEHFGICEKGKVLGLYWWQVAWNTPFFSDELKALFATKRDNYLVCKDFGLYIASLIDECSKRFVGYFKMPLIVYRAFSEFDLNRNYANDFSESLDRNVAFELLSVAVRAWGKKNKLERIAKFAVLPFRIYRTKNRCKKGIYKAQKGNVISRLYVD